MHSLYGSKTQGPENDSVESKHVALISHYMFNIITVVFDWPSPFIIQTLRDGTPQVQMIQDYWFLYTHSVWRSSSSDVCLACIQFLHVWHIIL